MKNPLRHFTGAAVIIALAIFAFYPQSEVSASVKTGEQAPNFTATDSNGENHQLSDFLGKTVVLEWTNHECPFVRKHYESGNMQAIQKAATDNGTVWLTIISSAPGKQGHLSGADANMVAQENNAHPSFILLDETGVIGQQYGAVTTPHMFVINDQGTIKYQGAIDDKPSPSKATLEGAKNYVVDALTAIKNGTPVEVSSTKPYGCGIKY